MENINQTNQWELNGECAKCRRRNWCHRDCTAKRKIDQALIQQTANKVFTDKFPSLKRYL